MQQAICIKRKKAQNFQAFKADLIMGWAKGNRE